ncbi:MAG: hypothetical protein JST75_22315 [Bacteroidetes bacterium]|nr:hypothetical protein [Bacteroidota bacterium]
MKKSLLALAAIYISVVAFTYRANGQGSNNVIAFTDTKTFTKSIQLVPFFDDSFTSATAIDLSSLNKKAIKDFASKFGTGLNEKWSRISDGFVSNFQVDGFTNRVYYDTKGRWQYTLKTYAESKLPREIRSIVKSIYYDYTITMVEEVHSAENMVYIIHQEDQKHIMKLRVSKDGDIDVMEEFVKG